MTPSKINLSVSPELEGIEPTINYMKRADLLVRFAKKSRKGSLGPNYRDDKCLILSAGIESLIGAGGRIICLNEKRMGETYISEVVYSRKRFIAVSEEPIAYTIVAHLR